VLTGALAALVALAKQTGKPDLRLLAWGASDLLREASRQTFAKLRRSMVATDVLAELGPAMQRLYPVPEQLEEEEEEAKE
jgi:NAD(P)H-hydrate repair Nnr-like enzyme with NAD(P)H-hydrate dehydratase domain